MTTIGSKVGVPESDRAGVRGGAPIEDALPCLVNPSSLATPRGYNHGVYLPLTDERGMLFVAGQVAWDANGRIVSKDFAAQFDQALANVLAVVAQAGGAPTAIGRLTIFVTDVAAYGAARHALREIWRQRFGAFYPAMTLVEVKALFEPDALLEIEAMAVVDTPGK